MCKKLTTSIESTPIFRAAPIDMLSQGPGSISQGRTFNLKPINKE